MFCGFVINFGLLNATEHPFWSFLDVEMNFRMGFATVFHKWLKYGSKLVYNSFPEVFLYGYQRHGPGGFKYPPLTSSK